jgi:putative transcriptional regulator
LTVAAGGQATGAGVACRNPRDDRDVPESLKGKLLIATPSLADPNFERTVVLILEHGDEGALGVVLNRASEVDLSVPLPEWAPFAAEPSVVFVGGPVGQGSMIALARAEGAPGTTWAPVLGPIGVLDLGSDADDVGDQLSGLRVFHGYAGWAAGQVEGEIEEGAWFVVDADPEDALAASPDDLWRAVLRRQPGRLSMFANFPADPALN